MTRSSRPFWLGEDRRKWDHVRLHVQIFEDARMGAYEQAVYGGIALHAELDTGEARPSLETLATYAKCDERTVRRVLERLTEWEYIEVEPHKGKASIYRLLPPPTLDTESGVAPEGADSQSGSARTDSPGSPDSESNELERTIEQQKTSSSGPAKRVTTIPQDFQPSERLLAWARQNHPRVDAIRETENFKDYALAKGRRMKDWAAAWRMWIRKAEEFAPGRNGQSGGHQPYRNHPQEEYLDTRI